MSDAGKNMGKQWETQRGKLQQKWIELLGEFPRRIQDLEPEVKKISEAEGILWYHVSFRSELHDRVTAYLLIPDKAPTRCPALVCIHGTTGGSGRKRTVGMAGFLPDDPPGETDIRWGGSSSQEEYGATVELNVPVGGLDGPVEWTITLNIDDDEDPCKANDDEKSPSDNTMYRVYYDHLARDMDNQGALNGDYGNKIVPNHYCFGASNHAYNGSTDPQIVPTSQGTLVFERVRIDRDPYKYLVVGECEVILNTIGSTSIGRGDWFVYNTSSSHINTSYSGTNIWEFNGRLNAQKWGTSTVGLYTYEQHEVGGYLVWGVGKIWHHLKQ